MNDDAASPQQHHTLRPWTLGRGIILGLLALALCVLAIPSLLPRLDDNDPNLIYNYLYSQDKSRSVDMTRATEEPDSYLTFGTSEFFFKKEATLSVPAYMFGEHNCGIDLNLIGVANDQSLNQGVAMGAFRRASLHDKAIFIVSPQWFFRKNGGQDGMANQFSFMLYRDFLQNNRISEASRDYLKERLHEFSKIISPQMINAANPSTPLDAVNGLLMTYREQLALRFNKPRIVAGAIARTDEKKSTQAPYEPNWDAAIEQGIKEGDAQATTNPFGIENRAYADHKNDTAELLQTFKNADKEYSDFTWALNVAKESGYELLVVILPVKGTWYDYQGVKQQDRLDYYQKIRSICDEVGISYADFSSFEYEKYFLLDTYHPGWTGWVRINNAIYDFIHDKPDAYLGGYKFGTAAGAAALHDKGIQRMKRDEVEAKTLTARNPLLSETASLP